MVSFPSVLQEVRCTVPGCPAVAHSLGRLCKHFIYCHFRSKMAVVQEGTEPLPRCDLCGMPDGRITSNKKTVRRNKNTQMRWRRRDVAITPRCLDATFSLTGEEEVERIEGV